MKIAFLWFGFDGRYGKWRDGLYAAMSLIEKENNVKYFDVSPETLEEVKAFNPDVVLFWEAPVTSKGKDADMWFSVCALPYKKCLLFAGGPLKSMDVKDFDLVFVESQINEEDCEREGIPYRRAFGVNTDIFKPQRQEVIYDAFLPATFAEWKRHELFAEAVGSRGAVAGRQQVFDTNGLERCKKRRVTILDELPAEEVCRAINASYSVLNTSSYWGGGQRATLEAMACGIPVIVMSDSPKNCEFVRESGGGVICDPEVTSIRDAIAECKLKRYELGVKGMRYIYDRFTEYHYATEIMQGIKSIL